MSKPAIDLNVIREEFEECRNSLALAVDISTSEIPLSEHGRLAFIEYGISSIRRFRTALDMLKNYPDGKAPN